MSDQSFFCDDLELVYLIVTFQFENILHFVMYSKMSTELPNSKQIGGHRKNTHTFVDLMRNDKLSLTNAATQDYYVDKIVIIELLACYKI